MKISRLISGCIGLTLAGGMAFGQIYVVSTIAGMSGATGYTGDGGPASQAQFANPRCVAVDSHGNYYIADSKNYVIRMVSASTGIITTIAGNGTPGYSGDGGPATSAQLSAVEGLAVDSAGNIYISDTANARVRIVTTDGNINTYAGNGTRGDSGDTGPAVNAQIFLPAGLAIDVKGNLYIADFGDGTVRKVSPQGIITTAAGIDQIGFGVFPGDGGYAVGATLGMPYAVAADETGNLFIADVGASSIRKVTPDGLIHTIVPNISTASLATDPAGNLYYGDYRQNIVVVVYPNGGATTIAGNYTPGYLGDGGVGITAEFDGPYGVALDSSGNIYVADYTNNVIRLLQPQPPSSIWVTDGATNVYTTLAPGEVVTLWGGGLGPANGVQATPDANNLIETQLAGTTVTFNGIPAPIISTSSYQVVTQVPFELNGFTQTNIEVSYQGQPVASRIMPLEQADPQIFTTLSVGSMTSAPQNSDGSVNAPGNAAAESSTISVFITGAGQTNPPGVDGYVPAAPANVPVQPVSAMVNDIAATVTSVSEVAGDIDGIFQVFITLPSSVTTSSAVPVTVQVGNVVSYPISIAVQ